MTTNYQKLFLLKSQATILSSQLWLFFGQIPFGVLDIMAGVWLGLVGIGLLDEFGWHAAPDLMGTDDGATQYQCTGSHYGSLADDGIVEHGASHADEAAALQGTGMNGGIVADGDIVFDDGGTNLVGDMHHGSVLNIHTVAHGDGCHITAHDGIEPHTTLVAHGHFAHDGGILAEITLLSPTRSQALYWFDDCHFSAKVQKSREMRKKEIRIIRKNTQEGGGAEVAHRRRQAAGSRFKVPGSKFKAAHRFSQILKIYDSSRFKVQ